MELGRPEWLDVTPSMAATWFAGRRENRPIQRRNVDFLKRQMLEGNYMPTGETILFNPRGEAMQGQHRLLAIMETGLTQKILCVFGIPDEYFTLLDQGAPRMAHEILGLDGVAYNRAAAPVARLAFQWNDTSGITGNYVRPSNQEVVDIVHKNPDIVTACAFVCTHRDITKYMPQSAASFAIWKLSQRSSMQQATDFITSCTVRPVGLAEDDPRFALNRVLINRQLRGGAKTLRDARDYLKLIFKAWNLYVAGEKRSLLKHGDNEPFPIPMFAPVPAGALKGNHP